jgi:hypothetical protein
VSSCSAWCTGHEAPLGTHGLRDADLRVVFVQETQHPEIVPKRDLVRFVRTRFRVVPEALYLVRFGIQTEFWDLIIILQCTKYVL